MGSTKVQTIQPAPPPAAPAAAQNIAELVQYYPQLVDLQTKYAPTLAANDYAINQEYSPQYAQLQQQIDQQLYPETAKLQEGLASQANAGINEPLPDWARQQYMSDFNAGLGMNANAPIGVSDRNIGLLNLQKQWQDYYRNLGLSVANRQPLQQGQQLNTPQLTQGITQAAGNALGYGSNTYGSQVAGYGAQLGGTYHYQQPSLASNILGVGAGVAGIGMGFGSGGFGLFGR